MFKIPTYDELEKKESERNEKSKELRLNLFEKRKNINLDVSSVDETPKTSTNPSASSSEDLTIKSPEKRPRVEKSPVLNQPNSLNKQSNTPTEKAKAADDDDDDLLLAFIDEKKDIIDKPTTSKSTTVTNNNAFKVPEPPRILAPNVNTNTNSGFSGGGPLIVNSKQKGNPILKHIRNVQWKYSETLVPDYCMSRNSCAFFLSMKYHLLNPTYIHQRVKELGRAYDLRVLLVHVDVKEPKHCIKELEKISIYSNLTMILCWTPEEVGRYLETYKAYEFKSADLIMEKSTAPSNESSSGSNQMHQSDAVFISNFTDFMCQIKSINKTDASTLRKTFGSIKDISKASKEELNVCPGLGPLKVSRLHNIFRTPFLMPKKI